MKIAEVTSAQLNEVVEISGQIVSVYDLTKGRKYVVQDDSGQMPVLLWSNVLEELPQTAQLRVGAQIAVRGRVSEYKEELRVVPARGADVRLMAPADAGARQATPIANLPNVGAGKSVWVTGVITSMETFSKGVKLHIDDGTGKATVLLWQNIYEGLEAQADLGLEAQIGVFGEVNHYRDEWEIVPRSKTEVVVLQKAK
jgi:DNA/RNA endonuclease YhcR with UshA esterase domain